MSCCNARKVLTDNHWHRCLNCLYNGRSSHVYTENVSSTANTRLEDYPLWKKIFDIQNGHYDQPKKSCCDDCAHGKKYADETRSRSNDCNSITSRSGAYALKVPNSGKVLWVNVGRSGSMNRLLSSKFSDASTHDHSRINTSFRSTKSGCCGLNEPLNMKGSINFTVYPGLNQPILDRFVTKSILKHQRSNLGESSGARSTRVSQQWIKNAVDGVTHTPNSRIGRGLHSDIDLTLWKKNFMDGIKDRGVYGTPKRDSERSGSFNVITSTLWYYK